MCFEIDKNRKNFTKKSDNNVDNISSSYNIL